jgi:hypothetical protein
MTDHVLVQVHLPRDPSLQAAADHLGVSIALLDSDYGVVAVDVAANLYAVRVDSSAQTKAQQALGSGNAEGVFSDVKVEPMGPPEK